MGNKIYLFTLAFGVFITQNTEERLRTYITLFYFYFITYVHIIQFLQRSKYSNLKTASLLTSIFFKSYQTNLRLIRNYDFFVMSIFKRA